MIKFQLKLTPTAFFTQSFHNYSYDSLQTSHSSALYLWRVLFHYHAKPTPTKHNFHDLALPTFIPCGTTVKEVNMCSGDLQTTFNDLYQGHKFTFFWQHKLLFVLVLFCISTARQRFLIQTTIVSSNQKKIPRRWCRKSGDLLSNTLETVGATKLLERTWCNMTYRRMYRKGQLYNYDPRVK